MSDDGDFPAMSPTPFTPTHKRVAYFYDQDVGNYVYYLGHPMKPHRIRMAHNLIVMYGMCEDGETELDNQEEGTRRLNDPIYGANGLAGGSGSGSMDNSDERYDKAVAKGARSTRMQCFRPRRATRNDMTRFHTDEYVDLLELVNPDNGESLTGGGMRCLTGDDCPPFEGVFEFCSISAGGSIAAAQKLNAGAADIAINWAGGLHHAKKTEASGFCYINDIVLGILELLRIHTRVLYIDVDVHHGDGVEEAFYTTDRVMTASFHRFGEFFPGTGDVRDVGMKRGKGYSVNVPLRDGINDQSFHSIFKPVMQHIIDWYRPGAIVLQMGADSLAGDKLGGFNLTLDGHAECARFIKAFGIPTMMLGGGGYTIKNVARAWTLETAVMCDQTLSHDLPYNQYMEYYGPRYKLEVLANNADDHNPPEYLEKIKRTVIDGLKDLPFAPSAPIKSIPSKSLGERLGLGAAELNEPEDDVEMKVKRLLRRKNGYDSSSSSEDESEDVPSTSRSRRQGGQGSRAPPTARRRDTDMSVDDDPCRVQAKKRTFFASSDPSLKPKSRLNGLVNGQANGHGYGISNGNGTLDMGRVKDHISMTMGGITEWSLGMSNSEVISPSRPDSPRSTAE